MRLNELRPAKGATKKRRRIGCGTGSGRGTTSGRGNKGQLSRSGGGTPPWFEGGQMPIYRRLPSRGFTNRSRKAYQVVNLSDLARFKAGATVGVAELLAARVVRKKDMPVKLLGQGELSHALTVQVHAASRSAVEKVGQSGGRVEILGAGTAAPREAPEGSGTEAESSEKPDEDAPGA
ncbi:MAG: 50S ribosomal protein L15 [Candidatus Eisenbacteria bacterium]|nr:50S ribosomal protein L15 [Candidatus Eisenbacteria bacterium]